MFFLIFPSALLEYPYSVYIMNIRFLVLIPFFLGGCTNFFMAPQAIPSFSGSEDIFSGVVTSPVTGS